MEGDTPISQLVDDGSAFLFETADQFAPALLVVDVINNAAKPAQVTSAYIEVQESIADLHPFLEIPLIFDPSCGGEEGTQKLVSSFDFVSSDGGPPVEPKITYSFGDESRALADKFSSPVLADEGTYANGWAASVMGGLLASGVNVDRLKTETFKCSAEGIAQCVKELSNEGRLSDALFTSGDSVLTRVSGSIDYAWADSHGRPHQRSSPFVVDLPFLQFDTGVGAECGAGDPVERNYKTVKLSLDRKNCRIPLPYKSKLAPHQSKRFALALVADKSSRHFFRSSLSSPTAPRPRRPRSISYISCRASPIRNEEG